MYLSPISDESSVLQALEQISHFKGLKDVEYLKIAHAPMFDNLRPPIMIQAVKRGRTPAFIQKFMDRTPFFKGW